jgi:hypothetical protein
MNSGPASWLGDVRAEFSRAKLPDKRLLARVGSIVESLQARPDHSFPDALMSSKGLKGFYRLASNPRVEHLELFEAHANATAQRVLATAEPLVLHDTTTVKPARATAEEVGEINTGAPGFFAHVALAVDSVGEGCPLGVLALETLHRAPGRSKGVLSGAECAKLGDKESHRWLRLVQESEFRLGTSVRPIHVMDREADSYALYEALIGRRSRFVIRSDDRTCWSHGQKSTVLQALTQQAVMAERQVELAHRDSSTTAPKSVRAERRARLAKLVVCGCVIELLRPSYLHEPVVRRLPVNVVRVFEPEPPQGQTPIEWIITTSEPIDTAEQIMRVVDIYRRRWIVEEFFKAMKSGCLFEERQLQEREALLLAFVFFLPIACQLLWLRSCSRAHPDAPGSDLLNDVQMKVLRHFAPRKPPQLPTRRELIWAIASLGGHIKNNGDPGWQVLGRAFKRLVELEQGWRAALQSSTQL